MLHTLFHVPPAAFQTILRPCRLALAVQKSNTPILRGGMTQNVISPLASTMKQYVIDEIRPEDHHKIQQYLDASYGPEEMGGVFWVPLAAEVLTEIQREHNDCQPFYVAVELTEKRFALELLVRTKNRIRCACIGYASRDQRIWIMEVVDAIFEKLGIAT